MNGKAKRAKILLPKRITRASTPSPTTTAPTNHIPTNGHIRNPKQIFSSTLQEGPVIPANEMRLVFEAEFSTIREDSANISDREILTIGEEESRNEDESMVDIEAPNRGQNPKVPKSIGGSSSATSRTVDEGVDTTAQDFSVLSPPSKLQETGKEPFCSSFRPSILQEPSHLTFNQKKTRMNQGNNLGSISEESNEDSNQKHNGSGDSLSDEPSLHNSAVSGEADSSILSPPSKLQKTNKEPFCLLHFGAFRASITTEPNHMSFNQKNGERTLRPRNLPTSILEESKEDSTLKSAADEEDSQYSVSESESEDSDEEEIVIQKRQGSKGSKKKRVDQGMKRHICQTFEKSFGYKRTLKRHILTEHEGQKYTCTVCGKDFGYKINLNRHMLTVHGKKKPHGCIKCEKSFGRQGDLNFHISTVHEKKKPHPCIKCEKSFGKKGNLDRHILTVHERKKPHECPKCEKNFGEKSTLTIHLRIHNGENPFICAECNKSFTQKGDLTRHMRIHNKEKPFECTTCTKEFSLKHNLKRHQKSQHPDKDETDSE